MEEQVIDRIILNGFPYEIDRKNKALLPKEVPRPAISFSALIKQDYSYRVIINPDGDIVPNQKKFFPTEITIPGALIDTPMVADDGGLAAFNQNSYKYEWGVLVYDKQIRERLEGKLPEINVLGDQYTIDWRLKELRLVADPEKTLNLKAFALSDDGEVYQAYYNTVLRKPVEVSAGIIELPRNLVLLHMPNEFVLDPVGAAREHGLQSTELLKHFPIKDKLKASIQSLTRTPLPDLVNENRLKAGLDDNQKQRPKM